jgi:DNA-binding response OmpR family regulator
MLPQLPGLEVLRKLKENPATADVPVVIVTARDDAQDEMRAMRAGAADYITKPWPPGELESSVKMALDYARASQPNRSPVRQSGQ